MSINVQGMAFNTAKDSRNLGIQAELHTNLGLACGDVSTQFSDFTKAEDHIKEVLINVFSKHSPNVDHLLHETDTFTLLKSAGISSLLFLQIQGKVKWLLLCHGFEYA